MSITLGHRLIGKEQAEKQQRQLSDQQGGGAIQLGDRLFRKKNAARVEAVAAPVTTPAPGKQKVPRATANKVPQPAPVVEVVAEPVASLAESEVETMLAMDPNAWDKVCEAESKRAEGWRPAVANMVLNAAPEATAKPIPEAVLDVLKAVVAEAAAQDLSAFAAAQAAAADVANAAEPPQD